MWELSKIFRLHQEVKSVFFLQYIQNQSCAFKMKICRSILCENNLTPVVEQKLIKLLAWFSQILMYVFSSSGV